MRPLGIVFAVVLFAAPAAAEPCSPDIVADAEVRELVRQALVGREDIDGCAAIEVTEHAVTVVLRDGRRATRAIARKDEVVPTLEALLMVPRRPSEEEKSEPAQEEPDVPELVMPAEQHDALAPAKEKAHPRFELSFMTDARAGDFHGSVGAGAEAFFEVGGWFGGGLGRIEYLQELGAGGPPATTSTFAALAGRRFRFRSVAIDLYGGPGVMTIGERTITVGVPGRGRELANARAMTMPRLLAGTRVSFRADSVLRPFLGFDVDLGSRQNDAQHDDQQTLPGWTMGLALGGTVGTL